MLEARFPRLTIPGPPMAAVAIEPLTAPPINAPITAAAVTSLGTIIERSI